MAGAWSRPIVPRVAREGWAEIKMPRPGEDRSDVGGAIQFNNIGPVPFSRSSALWTGVSCLPERKGDIAMLFGTKFSPGEKDHYVSIQ